MRKGGVEKFQLERYENFLFKIALKRADLNSTQVKFFFFKGENSEIELLKCNCREYDSDTIG